MEVFALAGTGGRTLPCCAEGLHYSPCLPEAGLPQMLCTFSTGEAVYGVVQQWRNPAHDTAVRAY